MSLKLVKPLGSFISSKYFRLIATINLIVAMQATIETNSPIHTCKLLHYSIIKVLSMVLFVYYYDDFTQ